MLGEKKVKKDKKEMAGHWVASLAWLTATGQGPPRPMVSSRVPASDPLMAIQRSGGSDRGDRGSERVRWPHPRPQLQQSMLAPSAAWGPSGHRADPCAHTPSTQSIWGSLGYTEELLGFRKLNSEHTLAVLGDQYKEASNTHLPPRTPIHTG